MAKNTCGKRFKKGHRIVTHHISSNVKDFCLVSTMLVSLAKILRCDVITTQTRFNLVLQALKSCQLLLLIMPICKFFLLL